MKIAIVVLTVVHGWASQYSPGVMEEVVRNRTGGMPQVRQLSVVPNLPAIAGRSCGDVGTVVAVRYEGRGWESILVADCSKPGDGTSEWMEEDGILLEMSHRSAVELGTVGRGIRVEMIVPVTVQVDDAGLSGPVMTK